VLLGYGATAGGTISPGNGGLSVGSWTQGCNSGTFRCWEYQVVTSTGSYAAQFKSSANSDKGGAVLTTLIGTTQPGGFPVVIKYKRRSRVDELFFKKTKALLAVLQPLGRRRTPSTSAVFTSTSR
jgi:hypothetical protein